MQVVVWSCIENKATLACVLTSPTPATVRKALRNGDFASLRSYFGPQYKSRLMIGAAPSKVALYVGGVISEKDLNKRVEDEDESVVQSTAVLYPDNVFVYSIDNIATLKDKIYLTTGIPTWRQHLFWYEDGHGDAVQPMHPYKIYVDGALQACDIIAHANTSTIVAGMPVNKQMYEQRSSLKVESWETFTRLDQEPWRRIYVVDLQPYLAPLDEYQTALTYYGFVLLHWPQLSMEAYRDVIAHTNITSKYPDLAPTLNTLRVKYDAERSVMARTKTEPLGVAITTAAVSIANKRVMMNLRNVFDTLECSATMPEIQYWAEIGGARYLIRKKHVRAQPIAFPSNTYIRVGMTCAVVMSEPDEQPRYMFFNVWPSGRVYVRGVWKEDEEMNFKDLVPAFATRVNHLIRMINKMQHKAFAMGRALVEITPTTITYDSITACLYWKRVQPSVSFRRMLACMDEWHRAGVIGPRPNSTDKTEFTLRKGMFEFDPSLLDRVMQASGNAATMSSYGYLTNPTVRAKWDLNYDGRPTVITHRTTDVKFEISNLRALEFDTAFMLIASLCAWVAQDPEWNESLTRSQSYIGVKKLKKLKEQDPELYDLRRFGDSNARVYSILCQNQRQPLIHTDDEVKRLGPRQIKALTKYWNFTLSRPAWYSCPNPAFPHMSFMVGTHPKGYCLPCCNKRPQVDAVTETCLTKHMISSDRALSDHVIAYGKVVEDGRLSHVPASTLGQLFPGAHNMHVVGCAQNFAHTSAGIVHALARVFKQTACEFVTSIAREILKQPINVYIGGLLVEYFADSRALHDCMIATFCTETPSTVIPYWPELFVECVLVLRGVATIVFVDIHATGRNITMHTSESTNTALQIAKMCLVLKLEQNYYPLAHVNAKEWFADGIAEFIYDAASPTAARVREMAGTVRVETATNDPPIMKYINMHNLVYGADINTPHGLVYRPQEYIPNISDGTPSTFEVPRGGAISTLLKYGVDANITWDGYTTHDGLVIALRTGHLIWHVEPGPMPDELKQLRAHDITFDIKDVNRAIMSRQPAEDRLARKIGPALYATLQYQLLIIEFVAHMDKERNQPMRETILRGIIPDDVTPADRALLKQQMNEPKMFAKTFAETVYEFDRMSLAEFYAKSASDRVPFLKKVVTEFAVEAPIADVAVLEFPNVYLPCEESNASYCKGSKLAVQQLDQLVDILASDLMNPLKRLYMLNNIWMDNNVNALEFIRRQTEIITVYKL